MYIDALHTTVGWSVRHMHIVLQHATIAECKQRHCGRQASLLVLNLSSLAGDLLSSTATAVTFVSRRLNMIMCKGEQLLMPQGRRVIEQLPYQCSSAGSEPGVH